jgi:hypothetical protein
MSFMANSRKIRDRVSAHTLAREKLTRQKAPPALDPNESLLLAGLCSDHSMKPNLCPHRRCQPASGLHFGPSIRPVTGFQRRAEIPRMLRVETRPEEIRRRRSGFHGDRRRIWQQDAAEIGQRTNHDRADNERKNVRESAPAVAQFAKRHDGLGEVTAAMNTQAWSLRRKAYLHAG